MPQTALHKWITPEGSQTPQVPADMKTLADMIDDDVPVYSNTAPPHRKGRIWYRTDTNQAFVSTGTKWKMFSGSVGSWVQSAPLGVAHAVFTRIPAATPVGTPDSTLTNNAGAITLALEGEYELTVSTVWNDFGGERRVIVAALNASTIPGSGVISEGRIVGSHAAKPPAVADYTIVAAFPPFTAAAGDVLRVFVLQDAGKALSLNPGSEMSYFGRTQISLRQVG